MYTIYGGIVVAYDAEYFKRININCINIKQMSCDMSRCKQELMLKRVS